MPGQNMPMPNGLSAEQVCQIAWYAGVSDLMKVFGVFEVNPETDVTGASVILSAQLLWHVIEGIAYRYGDYPFRDIESYATFHVCHDDFDEGIRFFCNTENQRWWVELKQGNSKKIIACLAEDYQTVKEGVIPEKWWITFQETDCLSDTK